MSGLALAELGPLTALDDGRELPIRGARARLVLALLALHRRSGLSVDDLVEQVWVDGTRPATARQSLSNIIGRLRTTLGADMVSTADGRYRLTDHVGSHRQRFLDAIDEMETLTEGGRWEEALELAADTDTLWRGSAWDGVDEAVSIAEDRRFLALRRLRFGALRTRCLVKVGRSVEAVEAYQYLVEHDPWNEDHRIGLAQALAETGQRTEAMRSVNEARSVLAEAGMTPGPDLLAIERSLLDEHGVESGHEIGPGDEEPLAESGADGGSERGLPRYRDEFVGRIAETARLGDLLDRGGLVTLVGPGGVGKTRLAVHGAASAAGFDRTWFIDLTTTDDPSRVGAAVGEVAGIPTGPGSAVVGDLARHYPGERILLVLDNCEHLIEVVAELAGQILDRSPAVTVLATSREAISIPGEVTVPVSPLPLGPMATPGGAEPPLDLPDELGPAVQLLAIRARAGSPDLDLLDHVSTAERICRLVDGLPLAIELAAGRLRTLGPSELADRLDGRLSLLAARRGRAARHRTLEAVVEWSYDLLTDEERLAFERLSVFVGSFTAEAAETVIADAAVPSDEVLDLLIRLAERSLLVTDRVGNGGQRFRLLKVLRAFALARHEARGERRELAVRHLDWAATQVEAVEAALRTPRQDAALAALVDDHDNFRAAREAALHEGRHQDALRITATVPLDDSRTRRRRLIELLAEPPGGTDRVTADATYTLASAEFELGRFTDSADHSAAAAQLYRDLDERSHEAYAQMMEGMSRWGDRARVDEVEELLVSAMDSFTALGDEMGQAYIAFLLASFLASNDGDLVEAAGLVQRSRDLFGGVGSPFGLAHAHESTAHVAVADGRLDDASRAAAYAVERLHHQGNVSCLAHAVDTSAMVKARVGRPDQAAILLGAAERLRQEAGTATKPWEAYAAAVAGDLLADTIGPEELDRFRQQGHDAPLTEVLAIVDDGVARA